MLTQPIENGIVVNRTTDAPHEMTNEEKLRYLELRQRTFQQQLKQTTGLDVDVSIDLYHAPQELIDLARELAAEVRTHRLDDESQEWDSARINSKVYLYSEWRKVNKLFTDDELPF